MTGFGTEIATGITLVCVALLLAGCETTGAGTRNVTCESMKFVWLSHKDTKGTIIQVAENNAAWVSICGKPQRIVK